MNAIASKGYAHGVEPKECVVKRGSRIKVMGVMELLVGVHDMNVSKSLPVSAQFSTKIGDQYKLQRYFYFLYPYLCLNLLTCYRSLCNNAM